MVTSNYSPSVGAAFFHRLVAASVKRFRATDKLKVLSLCTIALTGASVSAAQSNFAQEGDKRFSELFGNIEDSEYQIRWQSSVNAYQSPNRAQDLRFTYFDAGFAAQRRVHKDTNDDWSLVLGLASFGNANAQLPIGAAPLAVNGKSAKAVHQGIEIDYLNDKAGMRQNFIVQQGNGQGGFRLNLVASLEGIGMGVSEQGDYVYFFNTVEEVMRYSDLSVWDAAGNQLPARFEAADQNHFTIVVDDTGAAYPITIDPLSSYWSQVGNQYYAKYGFSVAYGNFNQGVGDIVVAAPYYDDGATDEGKVFVYYGQPTGTDTTPDWTAEVGGADSVFGYSVATGDLNGDGYDDLIVGAQNYGSGSPGAVFVWLSKSDGTGLPGSVSWSKVGTVSTGGFGMSVAAGNFNRDAYADVIVGAPYENGSGKVYVYNGSSSLPSSTPSWTATCGSSGANFGWSVACAGDLDGDGYQDIIIGAPGYSSSTVGGAAFIWHGGSSGLTPNPGTSSNYAQRLVKNQASAQFGYAVAGGNINNDGYSDVIVGAPRWDDNSINDQGAVFVYWGSSGSLSLGWSAESGQANAQFGTSVAVQDLSFPVDGYADVIVGAPLYDYAATVDGGGTFVWFGSSTGLGPNGTPSNAGWSAYNLRNGANSGASVAAGPNVKYLLHPGIIIGSPGDPGLGSTPLGAVNAFAD
jgi:hypothetical protein